MKIACNIQPLIKGGRAGIAYSEDACVRALTGLYQEDEFFLEYCSTLDPRSEEKNAGLYVKENVHLCRCKFPYKIYSFLSAFLPIPYRWLFKTNADVSHFFNFIIPPFVRAKKIVTIHDMAFRRFPQTVRAKTKFMLKLSLHKTIKRADRIVAVSEFAKKEILEFYQYPEEKIKVVYNGVDLQTYNADIRDKKKDGIQAVCTKYGIKGAYILYLGTLEPRKNLDRLIEAYALVRSRRTDIPLLVLAGGKGWLYGGIFQTIKQCRMENAIVFTGYVADEEKPLLLAGAKVFCFPSLYEGFGMPVLEAMACGTPVLTADNSALAEIAGDAAVLVNAYSVEEMANALERLCFDEGLRRNLREKGLERAKKFTWQNAAEQLYGVYKEAANG